MNVLIILATLFVVVVVCLFVCLGFILGVSGGWGWGLSLHVYVLLHAFCGENRMLQSVRCLKRCVLTGSKSLMSRNASIATRNVSIATSTKKLDVTLDEDTGRTE